MCTFLLDVVHCQTRNKCCSWAASKARAVWANYESKQATKVRVSKSRSSWVKPCEKIDGLMSKARDLCCETLQYGTFCCENQDAKLWANKKAYLRCEQTPHFISLCTLLCPVSLLYGCRVVISDDHRNPKDNTEIIYPGRLPYIPKKNSQMIFCCIPEKYVSQPSAVFLPALRSISPSPRSISRIR